MRYFLKFGPESFTANLCSPPYKPNRKPSVCAECLGHKCECQNFDSDDLEISQIQKKYRSNRFARTK